MFERVNPSHPDKIADRIAGALVDLAYTLQEDPKVAIEVLIGHGTCRIINETSVELPRYKVFEIVERIAGRLSVDYIEVPQDEHLAANQQGKMRVGDNGICRGVPLTSEQRRLANVARELYKKWPSDGKYLLSHDRLIVCQSNAKTSAIKRFLKRYGNSFINPIINPLGDWTGGTDVDCGATNRKLGSDMADSCTGGGLHGKDLSKGDVAVNIYTWVKAQESGKIVEIAYAIGDDVIDGLEYEIIVNRAKDFIKQIGGFEKLAEWGLF